jgi:uncharacterized protein YciI
MQSDALPAVPPTVPRASQPCFVFACWDGPQSASRRVADLDGHLAHVERHWRSYVVAGPMRDPGGEAIVGSMFLVLADTIEDAWALMKGDPYVTNGMYGRIDVHHLTQSIGLAVGGKIWDSWDAIRDRAAGGPPIAGT